MSTTVLLFSSASIPDVELEAFLLQAGAHPLDPFFTYLLTRETAFVRIYLHALPPLAELEPPALRQILGQPSQTRLLLVFPSTPQSEQLCLQLCCQFAARWPCLVDDCSHSSHPFYTPEDLLALSQEGRGFGHPDESQHLLAHFETSLEAAYYSSAYQALFQQQIHLPPKEASHPQQPT